MSLAEIRYAETLADISFQNDTLESYRNILKTILKAFLEQEDFRWFLLTHEIKQDIKKETLVKIFGNELDEKLLNFIMLLIDRCRISNLPKIIEEFTRIADERSNVLHILIKSATCLNNSQINRIKEKYRAEYKADSVRADVVIDNSIIGGLIVKIGDRVIDSSVKGRLRALDNIITT